MWWFRLLLVLLVTALGPVGCGFRPMYGKPDVAQPGGVSELAAIRVLAIEDRIGQQTRNALVHRITPTGEPGAAKYNLRVNLTKVVEGLGHQKDAKATIGRYTLSASYSLTDLDGRIIRHGNTRSVVSYNYLGPRYASIAGERDAEERAVSEVAEDIRRQLAAYFASAAEGSR
jgi:LPS-assembly lipoprotein